MANKENIGTPLKTRSCSDNFDWKEHCFICNGKCDPNCKSSSNGYTRSWSYVENSISTDHNSIYNKVLKTALDINDTTIIDRLSSVPNGDLVSVEARYHRRKGCLATYLSYARTDGRTPPKNVPSETDKYNKIYKLAAERLKEEYTHSIVVQNKVYYLSTLKERFNQVATAEGCKTAHSYKSSYLKKLLSDIWPEITFIHNPGKSDLVCSCNKSINDAIRETKQFEQTIQDNNECSYNITEPEPESDETIVHKAIGILRKRILDYNSKRDTYSAAY